MITQEILKKFLHYSPDTGVFTWIAKPGKKGKPNIGDIAGSVNGGGYSQVSFKGKKYKSHRLAWLYMTGKYPAKHIDHINGVCSDNRFINLRECTPKENSQNRKNTRNSSSKYVGVYWRKESKKWIAQIQSNGKNKYLGIFESEQLAHDAYCQAKKQLHTFNPYTRL